MQHWIRTRLASIKDVCTKAMENEVVHRISRTWSATHSYEETHHLKVPLANHVQIIVTVLSAAVKSSGRFQAEVVHWPAP